MPLAATRIDATSPAFLTRPKSVALHGSDLIALLPAVFLLTD
nr:hypothetical protein RSP673_05205 [Ralstonia solanacearum P673]